MTTPAMYRAVLRINQEKYPHLYQWIRANDRVWPRVARDLLESLAASGDLPSLVLSSAPSRSEALAAPLPPVVVEPAPPPTPAPLPEPARSVPTALSQEAIARAKQVALAALRKNEF